MTFSPWTENIILYSAMAPSWYVWLLYNGRSRTKAIGLFIGTLVSTALHFLWCAMVLISRFGSICRTHYRRGQDENLQQAKSLHLLPNGLFLDHHKHLIVFTYAESKPLS